MQLRVEQQAEMQREAGEWLRREMEGAPGRVVEGLGGVMRGLLGGEGGLVGAVVAWGAVVWGVGGVVGGVVEVVRVVRGLVNAMDHRKRTP